MYICIAVSSTHSVSRFTAVNPTLAAAIRKWFSLIVRTVCDCPLNLHFLGPSLHWNWWQYWTTKREETGRRKFKKAACELGIRIHYSLHSTEITTAMFFHGTGLMHTLFDVWICGKSKMAPKKYQRYKGIHRFALHYGSSFVVSSQLRSYSIFINIS